MLANKTLSAETYRRPEHPCPCRGLKPGPWLSPSALIVWPGLLVAAQDVEQNQHNNTSSVRANLLSRESHMQEVTSSFCQPITRKPLLTFLYKYIIKVHWMSIQTEGFHCVPQFWKRDAWLLDNVKIRR